MSDMIVTQYWMLGVIIVMAVFAVVAIIGYNRSKEK